MFWIGCGADANPLPRGKIEQCAQYGKELADAVEDALAKPTPLTDKIAAKYAEIELPFDTIPGKERWSQDALSKTHAVRIRAEKMLKKLDGGTIADRYPHYPVQVWKFGNQLTWVSLGGEVVIDYNLRLKKELAAKPLWI